MVKYSCLFDASQLKCILGSEHDCPEGFGRNEDYICWAKTLVNGEWVRRCEDYHSTEGDETGQCYPNSEGCTALLNEDGTSRFEYKRSI